MIKMLVNQSDPYQIAIISISCDNLENRHYDTQKEIVVSLRLLLSAIKIENDEEWLIYQHVKSILMYYSMDTTERKDILRKMEIHSPSTLLDNRICIIIKVNANENDCIDFTTMGAKVINVQNIIGFLTYHYNDNASAAPKRQNTLHITRIYIVKEFRRQGYASMLINHIQSSFTRAKVDEMTTMMHKNVKLPIIKVNVPLHTDTSSSKLFYMCGFRDMPCEISKKSFIAVDTELSNNPIRKDIEKGNVDVFEIIHPIYNEVIKCDTRNEYTRRSFAMVFIFPNCYNCRKSLKSDEIGVVTTYNCSKCRCVHYCSRQCQRVDWSKGGHKFVCKETLV
jgi:ribosomal protein S18 acetylase RimI-like enzyme